METTFDREAHQKKVCVWFQNPTRFCEEINNEQRCHPNKCIYHLSKMHQTAECNVMKECDRLLVARQTIVSGNTSSTLGQLCHITDEVFEDTVLEDFQDTVVDLSNDTYQDVLNCFA